MIGREGKTYWVALVGILILAVVLRVGVAVYLGDVVDAPPLLTDQRSYHALGARLAAGHGFSFETGWYPFTPAETPTAHWSFLYSLYAAGCLWAFRCPPPGPASAGRPGQRAAPAVDGLPPGPPAISGPGHSRSGCGGVRGRVRLFRTVRCHLDDRVVLHHRPALDAGAGHGRGRGAIRGQGSGPGVGPGPRHPPAPIHPPLGGRALCLAPLGRLALRPAPPHDPQPLDRNLDLGPLHPALHHPQLCRLRPVPAAQLQRRLCHVLGPASHARHQTFRSSRPRRCRRN